MSAAQLVAIEDSHGRRFAELFEIYASSIPRREQKKRDEIAAFAVRPDYRILALEEDSTILAFSIVFLADRAPIALLDYMATREDRRSKGLGAAMFRASLEAAQGRLILVEVDSDRELNADNSIRARRKAFYRRLGCFQVAGLDYLLPLPGDGALPLMDLLVHFNGHRRPIGIDELREGLGIIFKDVYAQSETDPRIGLMLEGLADPLALH
jgi:GNAT superfamily N-acetyltransferase